MIAISYPKMCTYIPPRSKCDPGDKFRGGSHPISTAIRRSAYPGSAYYALRLTAT